MSLRKIAKELGVSPAYLSYMVSGKRPCRPVLYQRYQYFVNTSVNTKPNKGETSTGYVPKNGGRYWTRTSDLRDVDATL